MLRVLAVASPETECLRAPVAPGPVASLLLAARGCGPNQPGPRPTGAACQGLGGPQSMVRPCLPAGRRRVATAKMMTSGATSSCTWDSVRAGFAMLAGMLAILQVMGCWPRSFDGRHLFECGSAGLARLVRGCPFTCTRWRLAARRPPAVASRSPLSVEAMRWRTRTTCC